MYSDENLTILYENYKCKKNHDLKWTGATHINSEFACTLCNEKSNLLFDDVCAIRWECSKCNEFYCQKCLPISKYYKCPNYHSYNANDASNNINYSSFTCDFCSKKDYDLKNIYMDKTCNVTFCKNCIADKDSFIYFVRED